MVSAHFIPHQVFAYLPGFKALFKQSKEKLLLLPVGVFLIAAQQTIFSKDSRPQAISRSQQRFVLELVRGGVIHRQPGFPWLGLALGIVQQARIRIQMVKIVPAVFQMLAGSS